MSPHLTPDRKKTQISYFFFWQRVRSLAVYETPAYCPKNFFFILFGTKQPLTKLDVLYKHERCLFIVLFLYNATFDAFAWHRRKILIFKMFSGGFVYMVSSGESNFNLTLHLHCWFVMGYHHEWDAATSDNMPQTNKELLRARYVCVFGTIKSMVF